MSKETIVDFKTLEEFFADDKDILDGFLKKFCESYQDLLNNIKIAIEEKDSTKLDASAHEYKGTVANVFCEVVISLSLKLEQMGKSGQVSEEAASIFEDLQSKSDEMIEEIKNHLA